MIYITGDIHGNARQVEHICRRFDLTADDTVVLLGDVGANFYMNKRDNLLKGYLSDLAPTIFCIHGNHEARPQTIEGYIEKEWNGGTVLYQEKYPKLLFPKDGAIFDLEGYQCLVIGGAYSVDKFHRLRNHWSWWPDEQPSEETKAYVEKQIAQYPIDIVFSHTCPGKYTPTECFLQGVDQSEVDKSTEEWLDKIEESIDYKAWYCGHWHTDKRIDKLHFLYNSTELLQDIALTEEMKMEVFQ